MINNPVAAPSAKVPHVVRCGWLDRELDRGYVLFPRYSRRYVVLTANWLRYYHHQIELANVFTDNSMEFTDIPLSKINIDAMMNNATAVPSTIHIELATGKTYKFRANSVDDAIEWRMAVVAAKTRLLPSAPVSTEHASQAMDAHPLDLLSTLKEQDELVGKLEHEYFSSMNRTKFVAETFFVLINKYPIRERNNRAREVRQSLLSLLFFIY
jgi:hypothetical protein